MEDTGITDPMKTKFTEESLASDWIVSKYFQNISKGENLSTAVCLILFCEVRFSFSSNDNF